MNLQAHKCDCRLCILHITDEYSKSCRPASRCSACVTLNSTVVNGKSPYYYSAYVNFYLHLTSQKAHLILKIWKENWLHIIPEILS